MKNQINERIRLLIKKEKITNKFFCESIGISTSTLKTIFARDSNPSSDILIKISNEYPKYSLRWILKGEGEVEVTTSINELSILNESDEEYQNKYNFKLVPLYLMNEMEKVSDYIPFIDAKKGDISIVVTGNNMDPMFTNGCYILIREVNNWQKFIEYGQVYVIELLDGRRILREIRRGKDSNHLHLNSYGNKFDSIEISTDFIVRLWLVLAKYQKMVM